MERLGRRGPWTVVAVTTVLISGLAVSCSNNVTPATPSSATVVSNASGTATPVPSETETSRAELKVPTDLVNKSADAAEMQLSAAGIPFSTSFWEAEENQVGVVLKVDPVGGTVLSQGDSVRLLVGKPKDPASNNGGGTTSLLPSDLVGTWHGGVGSNYFLTLSTDGRYEWEHRRVGPFDAGVVQVDGANLTFTSGVDGKKLSLPFSLSASPEVYGYTFVTLHLGEQSYVRE